MTKYHQGRYTPINKHKYRGDISNIIWRSSWEFCFLRWCDMNPSVLEYSSEETIIPYRCATDGKIHRYFCDFRIKIKTTTGDVKTYLVEVKPYKETLPPKEPTRKSRRYLQESFTYIKNQSKWEAARQYCADRGWHFIIITEKELGL